MHVTYKYRIKDGSSGVKNSLRKMSGAVNFVWNFCCEIDRKAAQKWKSGSHVKRPSKFDLTNLCRGVTRELGLHSDTVDEICGKFIDARNSIFPQTPRFRTGRRNLGWIPFSNFNRPAKLIDGKLHVLKKTFRLWFHREIPQNGKIRNWSISADSRGRWYVNLIVQLPDADQRSGESVGIDLGLKTLATCSDGVKIEMPRFYRRAENELAKTQRFKLRKRARALHAKVQNQRKHFLHVVSNRLVRDYAHIVIGDVSSAKLAKTRMAKSVLDAGWSMLKSMIQYKAIAQGSTVQVVSERLTSQTCSCCGVIPDSSPKGIGALGIRHWVCESCGTSHDRDVNAAKNILRVGAECRPLVAESCAA